MSRSGAYVHPIAAFVGGPWPSKPPSKEQELQALRRELEDTRQRILELVAKPHGYAWVTDVIGDRVELVTAPGQVVLVGKPTGLDIGPGDSVRIHGETGQIVDVADRDRAFGLIQTVRRIVSEKTLEVEHMMDTRMVRYVCPKPKPGDRVLLDSSNNIAVKNLGPAPTPLVFQGDVSVAWEEIGGLAEAKRALREAIEEPFTKGDVYARYGKRGVKGVLLSGPPGNGKSMLAKAAATSFAKIHGASLTGGGFIYVRGPELLNHWAGKSEENIRQIFKSARLHKDREGYPALVFLDECDAVLAKRGRGMFEGMERTTVPQFLAEMDGLEDSGALIILATNRPETLDPAVVREGRVDRKIHVGRPTRDDAEDIVARALKGRPLAGDVKAMAPAAVTHLYRSDHVIASIQLRDGKAEKLLLAHVASGAMLVGVVEQATQLAIRRELDGDEAAKGVGVEDLRAAVERTLEENRAIDHREAAGDVVDAEKIAAVVPVRSERAAPAAGRVWMPGS